MEGKPIPIKEAKKIAESYGYNEVIIFAAHYDLPRQHVTTWGDTKEACKNAGLGGDFIKKHLKWTDGISNYTVEYENKIADMDKELEILHCCIADLYEAQYNSESDRIKRIKQCLSEIEEINAV